MTTITAADIRTQLKSLTTQAATREVAIKQLELKLTESQAANTALANQLIDAKTSLITALSNDQADQAAITAASLDAQAARTSLTELEQKYSDIQIATAAATAQRESDLAEFYQELEALISALTEIASDTPIVETPVTDEPVVTPVIDEPVSEVPVAIDESSPAVDAPSA